MLIARLIADPDGLSAKVNALVGAIEQAGATVSFDVQGGGMIEFQPVGIGSDALRDLIDVHVGAADVLIADDVPQVPHLFISDMDSTMIGQECIDELADFAGLKPQIAAITERAMQGELDFASALRERVLLLKGLPAEAIDQCLAQRIRPMAGAKTLVGTLKARGCRTVLVTGGFHQFADPVAEMLGFEHVVANRLEIAEGKLTGGLVGPICDASTKLATLVAEAAALGPHAVTLATGDGANDIPMIEAAHYGIAYRAKPKARAAARGWIDHGDLSAILRLCGVPEEQWVRG